MALGGGYRRNRCRPRFRPRPSRAPPLLVQRLVEAPPIRHGRQSVNHGQLVQPRIGGLQFAAFFIKCPGLLLDERMRIALGSQHGGDQALLGLSIAVGDGADEPTDAPGTPEHPKQQTVDLAVDGRQPVAQQHDRLDGQPCGHGRAQADAESDEGRRNRHHQGQNHHTEQRETVQPDHGQRQQAMSRHERPICRSDGPRHPLTQPRPKIDELHAGPHDRQTDQHILRRLRQPQHPIPPRDVQQHEEQRPSGCSQRNAPHRFALLPGQRGFAPILRSVCDARRFEMSRLIAPGCAERPVMGVHDCPPSPAWDTAITLRLRPARLA